VEIKKNRKLCFATGIMGFKVVQIKQSSLDFFEQAMWRLQMPQIGRIYRCLCFLKNGPILRGMGHGKTKLKEKEEENI